MPTTTAPSAPPGATLPPTTPAPITPGAQKSCLLDDFDRGGCRDRMHGFGGYKPLVSAHNTGNTGNAQALGVVVALRPILFPLTPPRFPQLGHMKRARGINYVPQRLAPNNTGSRCKYDPKIRTRLLKGCVWFACAWPRRTHCHGWLIALIALWLGRSRNPLTPFSARWLLGMVALRVYPPVPLIPPGTTLAPTPSVSATTGAKNPDLAVLRRKCSSLH